MQIMFLYEFSKFVLAFIVLILWSKVHCQRCGQSGPGQTSALGEERPTEGQWPWMVAVMFRATKSGNYSAYCTGFLIDRKHVLTAAHCIDTKKDAQYSVRIGKVNLNKGETYSIARMTVHDGYRPFMFYDDIAILTLDREVKIPNFNPVCLPDAELSKKDLTDFSTTLVGWGLTEPLGPISKYLKQLSRLRVMSNRECSKVFNDLSQFPGGFNGEFICSGEIDSCQFLSGSPLMYKERRRWFVVGLVSFGYSCGRPDSPGGYLRISSFLNWIRENTKD